MSESDSKSHWRSLAEDIGAEIPDEPDPVPAEEESNEGASEYEAKASTETGSEVAPECKPQVARKPSKPAPKPVRTNHWSLLAGELGLEVPEEPAPVDVREESAPDETPEVVAGDEQQDASKQDSEPAPAVETFDALFESPADHVVSDEPSRTEAAATTEFGGFAADVASPADTIEAEVAEENEGEVLWAGGIYGMGRFIVGDFETDVQTWSIY